MKFLIILILFFNLFQVGCDNKPDMTDRSLPNPELHHAVEENDFEKVKALLALGKCSLDGVKKQSEDDEVNEIYKASYIHYLIANELCSDVNYKNIFGKTAIFYVRSLEMAELLVQHGADVNIKDRFEYTPLHYAHNPQIAKFFLDQGLDIEAKGEGGWTPLRMAVNDERIAVARFLSVVLESDSTNSPSAEQSPDSSSQQTEDSDLPNEKE